MALVAYSDESDISDDEEEFIPANGNKGTCSQGNSSSNGVTSNENISKDTDENFRIPNSSNIISKQSLFDRLPEASMSASSHSQLDDADDLTDVPTKESWKFTKQTEANANTSQARRKPPRQLNDKKDDGLNKALEYALGSSALYGLCRKKTGINNKVKLSVPSLSEFVDETEDTEPIRDESLKQQKSAPSSTGSGLLNLLPRVRAPVKGKEANRSLTPYVLTTAKKPPQPVKKAPMVPRKTVQNKPVPILDDNSDDDDTNCDYFSLDTEMELPPIIDPNAIINEISENPNIPATKNVHSISIPSVSASSSGAMLPNIADEHSVPQVGNSYSDRQNDDMEALENEELDPNKLDDAEWRKFTGKKRRGDEARIDNFIEVNADDVLLSKDEWMRRSMAEDKPKPQSKKRGDMPSQQQKRKHQITYLAHQAKEREIELKNDWASGRAKKQQAREKYGF